MEYEEKCCPINDVDGHIFDLTSEQFGDEVLSYEDNPEQMREVHFAKEEKFLRYKYLREQLKLYLEGHIPTGLPGGFFIYENGGSEEILFAEENVIRLFDCYSLDEFREYTGNSFKGMVHPDDLNKIENQGIIQKEKFSLDEQIRYCILSFEEKLDEKNININVDLDEITIKSDKALLEIVWNNLISNAVKYTPYGGTISIDLKKDKNGIIVRVADNGCGMSRETQKHIFDKFYQGDASHSQEGNGLGLALVKQVINMLDCKIEVKSDIGKGSEFIVVI